MLKAGSGERRLHGYGGGAGRRRTVWHHGDIRTTLYPQIQKESGPSTRGVNGETPPPAKTVPLSSDFIISSVREGVKDRIAGDNGLEKFAENDILNKKEEATTIPQDVMAEQTGDLAEEETAAVLAYKSSESYKINAMLRDKKPLAEIAQTFVDNLDKALIKLPSFKGTVYRNLSFGDFGGKEDMDAFLALFTIGEKIVFGGYTSASEIPDGHPVTGEYIVNMEIQSITGRRLTGFGNNSEREVLFSRNCVFVPIEITIGWDGNPLIKLLELER